MRPRFTLERLNWRRVGPNWLRLPGGNPVATFDEPSPAQSEAARLELVARGVVGHPFRCGPSLHEVSTLPEFAFLDWLHDGGLDPPDPDPDGSLPWVTWGDLHLPTWSASQSTHLWEGANRVRFYHVHERIAPALHCVVRIDWQPHQSAKYVSEAEGGTPVTLWHSHDEAAQDCEKKNRFGMEEVAAAVRSNGDCELLFDPRNRLRARTDPFADEPGCPRHVPVNQVPHCEVLEVERGEPQPLGERAYLVLRRGWIDRDEPETEVDWAFVHEDEHGGVPVRVFHGREEAERCRDGQEESYRATANPFRFGRPRLAGVGREVDVIRAAIRNLGYPPPEIDPATANLMYPDWRVPLSTWWDRTTSRMTPEQREAVWSWFPDLRYFEVREVRVGDGEDVARPPRRARTLYLVRATNWVPDGGPNQNPLRFLGAFPDRDTALAACERADRQARTANTPLPMRRDRAPDWEEFSSWSRAEMRRHFLTWGLIDERTHKDFVPDSHWWEDNRWRFRKTQADAFWEVMDRVRLYEVRELETEVGE